MKILFHHLAKTAGTSLIESFLGHFGERVCPSRYDPELSRSLMTSSQYDFYHGHFSFDKVSEFSALNPGSFIFTFVRNPINRVISQYYNWVDKERTEKEFRAIAARGLMNPDELKQRLRTFENDIAPLSLVEFLASPIAPAIEVRENHQTRYLCRAATYRANHLQGLVEACSNIERFYNFVGVMEWYDLSLQQLSKVLSLPGDTLAPDVVMNTNEAKKVRGSYVIEPAAWDGIVACNGLDMSLFTFAAALFRGRYAVTGTLTEAIKFPTTQGAKQSGARPKDPE